MPNSAPLSKEDAIEAVRESLQIGLHKIVEGAQADSVRLVTVHGGVGEQAETGHVVLVDVESTTWWTSAGTPRS